MYSTKLTCGESSRHVAAARFLTNQIRTYSTISLYVARSDSARSARPSSWHAPLSMPHIRYISDNKDTNASGGAEDIIH